MNHSNMSTTRNGSGHFPGELDADDAIGYDLFAIYRTYSIILICVFILPTIVGNVLILSAIGRFPSLRKTTSCILIGNLAVADLLVGVFVFPLDILIWLQNDFFRVKSCLLYYSLVYTSVGASVFNLFLLSLERFHAIICPLKHASVFTKGRIYIAISIVWVCTVGVAFLPMFGWHQQVREERFQCGSGGLLKKAYNQIVSTMVTTSMTANGVFFFIIVRVAIRATSTLTDLNMTESAKKRLHKNIRHTRVMLIVSGLFIVFWTPFCIVSLIPNPSTIVQFIREWTATFGLINSAVNWVVYGCRSHKFREAFKAILTCKCVSENVRISSM